MSKQFIPCLKLPQVNNKYYILKSNGGYNTAIKPKIQHPYLNSLRNCVAWCLGRFHEILQDPTFSKLKPVNAGDFIKYADKSLKIGQEPQIGACMVWSKKGEAGHVAIVEIVKSPTEIITSESGWSAKVPFWNQTRKQGKDGNWGQSSAYKFLGFIYNPAPCCQNTNISTNTPTTSTNTPTNTPTVNKNQIVQTAKLKDTKLSGTYTVTADDGLNLRLGAGTSFDSQILMPKGTKVSNYGYYNAVGNVKWLYVQCIINGKKYLGYCSMNYLKK